mgnify:FL=1
MKQAEALKHRLGELQTKFDKQRTLAKGEFVILIKELCEAEPFINNSTGRINRPVVALFQGSKETPYEIKLHETHGLSCDCPSWIYNKNGNRTCKHTQQILTKIK